MSGKFSSFVELLSYRVQQQPEKTVFTFLQDEEIELGSLTYKELEKQAQKIATHLQSLKAQGKRALLLYQPSLEYIAAFIGCLYAGVIAVPAYPPRANKSITRLEAIVNDAQATIALTSENLKGNIENRLKVQCIATDELSLDLAENYQQTILTPDNLAFLQYTSGSTGAPKGVMVSHGNLLHNSHLINLCFQDTTESHGISWLPPYHDMGLIGGILQPIYVGASMMLMSPVTFLQRPYRWLKAISKYQATTSGGPNFAYDLCISQITDEQKATLDLSHWELAFSGAEPIRNETIEQFSKTFAECGFRKEAFYPCYGMAETTLIVSGGEKNTSPVIKTVAAEGLKENKIITKTSENTTTLVSCGQTIAEQTIIIVNPDTCEQCAENEIGEIWVAGESVTQGYWQKPELTEHSYQAYLKNKPTQPFLRTGDLGFLQAGELFVTGRLKDLIIIRGRNHYPQDIELTVNKAHPAVREGNNAAFAVEINAEEKLVIVTEIERTYLRKLNIEEVTSSIRKAIIEQHELQTHAILLLKTGSIPKTSSGKIRRHTCKQGFLDGSLNVVGELKPTIINTQPLNINYQTNDIESWLVSRIAQGVGVAPQTIDINEPFASYGLDSVQAVRLTAELEDWLGIKISPTLAYDYPTIASLSGYLISLVLPNQNQNKFNQINQNKTNLNEDIAIIGIGCRFPGATNPQEFWQILKQGKNTVAQVPAERWQGEEWGAFVQDVDKFDAQFFGISPREATYMDPQQRLLLEVSWEALEYAGIAPTSLAKSNTGVFVGISSNDYSQLQLKYGIPVNAYAGTGNAHSIAANRLSYILDLRGPSLSVDTACSSSLVAVHLAANSLKQGECKLAIVAGVNLILSPELTQTFTEAGMMAEDGRCKTFDQDADGYVRGEGCGVIILKPLTNAIADGDNILALIKGSAINQDGRSNGLTAPNGISQEEVIYQAINNANIQPQDINYIEAHGTGTPLGDPIEVNSLKRVLAQSQQPCYLGSVKTNIGHLEAAAGIAGLIKVVLSLQNEEIPPHLNFSQLNSLIDLENILKIPTSNQSWLKSDTPRIAGISSFGFGGTNAHIILQEGEVSLLNPPLQKEEDEEDWYLLTLSAKNESALEDLVKKYKEYLTDNHDLCIKDICLTTNKGRSHHQHRLAIVNQNTTELNQYLTNYLSGYKAAKILKGESLGQNKLAFLFTGQGSQYSGMGSKLYQEQSVFREALDKCANILDTYLEQPLLDVLYNPDKADLLNETEYTQPAIFAVEYALAQLWQHWGIKPSVVMGHSVGEYVAATIAGVFSLEDGLKLIATRGKLMQALPEKGEMLAIFAEESEVKQAILGLERVSIAAINGEKNIVISGDSLEIKTVRERLETEEIKTKKLQVSHAFHSPLMLGMIEEFRKVAQKITYNLPSLKIVSNLTGKVAGKEIASSEYWVNHILQPVQFARGMATLYKQGERNFLEIGAKPILLGMARQMNHRQQGLYLPSLRPPKIDNQQILQGLANLYVQGYKINWDNFASELNYQKISLPTYPFQRQRYWIDESNKAVNRQPNLNLDWLYQVEWQIKNRIANIKPKTNHNWLILADKEGVGEQLAQKLQEKGDRTTLVYQKMGPIGPKNNLTSEITRIIHLWSLDVKENNLSELKSPITSILDILQGNIAAKLWIITKNAIPSPTFDKGEKINIFSSTIWGLAQVIAFEYPESWGGIIDLDNNTKIDSVIEEITHADGENQVLLKNNSRFVPRLTPAKINPKNDFKINSDATYLITGGLGALGLKFASYLAKQGAKYLVLLGRNKPNHTAQKTLNKLAEQGIKVIIKQVDITDFEKLEIVFQEIKSSLPPFKGIVHAAGTLADGLLQNQTWAKFTQVMSPKVEGSWNLHNLTQDLDLDFFIMFSSAASLLGSPGQGNYAAANAFLDNLAHYRRSLGLRALTINWGALNTGMAAKTNLSIRGLELINPESGFELLSKIMSADVAQVGIISAEWELLKQQFPVISPYFSLLLSEKTSQENKSQEIFTQLLEYSSKNREEFLTNYLQKTIAEILQLESEKLAINDSLLDVGMDSLMVMEAINQVKSDLQLMLYPREFYERPRIIQLAKYLSSEFTKTHTISQINTERNNNLSSIFNSNYAKNTIIENQIEQPIAFILSSPRSGSTLLRVMLQGHPELFAPPELHLLPFTNMQEREEKLSLSYLGEGLKTTLMQLKNITSVESENLVQKLIEEKTPITEVYTMLQTLTGNKLLIDKSPTYSSQKETLVRAENTFTNAKYIHLVRHPYSVIESFARMRMDKLLTDKDVNPYHLAESIWNQSNQNVLDLSANINSNKYYQIRYEDLVTQPEQVMRGLCDFLEIEFNNALLQPYQGERQTSGIYNQSMSVGDPNFLTHQNIEPKLAENWQNINLPIQLSDFTRDLAAKFDYSLPNEKALNQSMSESYLNIRGLQLCLCSWGPEAGPLVLCLHGILEQGAAWLDVAVGLAQKGYRVVAPDLRGHGKSDHVGKGGSYNLLDFLGDIDAIASNLTNKPFTLVGHSLGSVVAAMFASIRPQKIQKLVLVETVLPTETNEKDTAENLATHLDYLASPPQHQIFSNIESAAERLRLATPSLSPKTALKLAQRILEPCQGGFRWRWAAMLLTRAGIGFNGISKRKYLGLLRCLTVPITLIYGNRSNFNRPEDLSEQEKAMPDANKIVVSGGHNLHLEAGSQLAEIIANC